MCVGNRHGDYGCGWPYVYRSDPNSKDIQPICWDSQLHRIKGCVFPDICRRNVLFSDGHVETMSERKFLKLMRQYSIEQPNKFQPTDTPGRIVLR